MTQPLLQSIFHNKTCRNLADTRHIKYKCNTSIYLCFPDTSMASIEYGSDKRLQRVMLRRHNEGTRSGARRYFRRPSRGNDFRRGARTRLHLQSLSSRTTPDLLQTHWNLLVSIFMHSARAFLLLKHKIKFNFTARHIVIWLTSR